MSTGSQTRSRPLMVQQPREASSRERTGLRVPGLGAEPALDIWSAQEGLLATPRDGRGARAQLNDGGEVLARGPAVSGPSEACGCCSSGGPVPRRPDPSSSLGAARVGAQVPAERALCTEATLRSAMKLARPQVQELTGAGGGSGRGTPGWGSTGSRDLDLCPERTHHPRLPCSHWAVRCRPVIGPSGQLSSSRRTAAGASSEG
ncbi:uncharacterized protein LOC104858403 isoform X2 [Fukomys damarensis]|uniref:uncharacterized protein LOC104858403 isoform X2 n=1 Tax=Fukomys damarensis TaxID=885580 RepID=UPI00053F35CC|nr:uncharacterized protein LOC104858403 isoform X2 [Fukomys damarensis]